ncbi:MAG TPA: hypothetical protein VKV26_00620 [Dehalococcoidia bacterium]|nr:hypothetical protein [Dehalococcoidia bacterium]
MARIEIAGGKLAIVMEGMDKLWALKSRLELPLAHVTDVVYDPAQASRWRRGLRLAGTAIPGVITAGSFWRPGKGEDDGWAFWDVHGAEKAIVISTSHEHYKKVVVGVDDPEAAVRQIQAALDLRPAEPELPE